jgi:hypothetical protein
MMSLWSLEQTKMRVSGRLQRYKLLVDHDARYSLMIGRETQTKPIPILSSHS